MSSEKILGVVPLGFPWPTLDPFLFCAHHDDQYPPGTEQMGPPPESLKGRNIGMDFEVREGWRMYHGDVVPGFPRHPHRGFETITLARKGLIDHSDSLGATARFGNGDVQWMTAGSGIVHSEMFPLVNPDADNPTELFQVWLNLPAADKMVDPYFTMLWSPQIPTHVESDEEGRTTTIRTVAGALNGTLPPDPPPNSWASRRDSQVAVWTIAMEPGARWSLPAGPQDCLRTLYYFAGEGLRAEGVEIPHYSAFQVKPDAAVELRNGSGPAELLMLQGRPIGEPVAQHGPFVMNHQGELRQAFLDYQRTEFGGWPWQSDGPVHERDKGRFAIHADQHVEHPEDFEER